jgi:DNA-binding winged helix-turn-helix (wHTH) protein
MAQLTRVLRDLEPGQETTVTVYRGGAQIHFDITLDEKPHDTQTEQQQEPQQQPEAQEPAITPDQGFFEDWFSSLIPGFGG